eukprot:1412926-Rhodomonas_salina.1
MCIRDRREREGGRKEGRGSVSVRGRSGGREGHVRVRGSRDQGSLSVSVLISLSPLLLSLCRAVSHPSACLPVCLSACLPVFCSEDRGQGKRESEQEGR